MSSRSKVHVLLAAACVIASAVRADAQFTGIQLNGSAVIDAGGRLQLTPGGSSAVGSAFFVTPRATSTVTRVSATFNYAIEDMAAPGGIAFVIQGSGPTALGALNDFTGHGAVGSSLAALFRSGSYRIVQNGPNGPILVASAADDGRTTFDATVTYDAASQTFAIAFDGVTVLSQTDLDLFTTIGPELYIGFTAASTGATRVNSITTTVDGGEFMMTATPEPASIALTATGLLGLLALNRRRRRTR